MACLGFAGPKGAASSAAEKASRTVPTKTRRLMTSRVQLAERTTPARERTSPRMPDAITGNAFNTSQQPTATPFGSGVGGTRLYFRIVTSIGQAKEESKGQCALEKCILALCKMWVVRPLKERNCIKRPLDAIDHLDHAKDDIMKTC